MHEVDPPGFPVFDGATIERHGAVNGADMPEPPPAKPEDYAWAAGGTAPATDANQAHDFDVTFAWTLADKPVPQRRWIVPEWIPTGQVTALSAEGGKGKTHVVLQLMVSLSTGTPWLGLEVERAPSFAIFAEDDDAELHFRLANITKATGVSIADLRDLAWRSAVVDPCEMVEIDERGATRATPYFRWLEKTVIELGSRLVVLDAATNLFGGDEIKRRQVNGFLLLLRRLAVTIDGAVLLLIHPSVQGVQAKTGMSGSTHWSNAVRSRLYLTSDDGDDADPDVRILTKLKANYSTVGDAIRMRWSAGTFLTFGGPPEPVGRAELSAKTDSVFLSLLAKTDAEGVVVCPSLTARNYAPTVFTKHPAGQAMPKRAFEQAMNRLLEAGAIKIVEYGKPSDRRKKLVLA